MEIEPQSPTTNEIMEANKHLLRRRARRFLVALGVGMLVGLVMTWWESRKAAPEID